MTQLRQWPTYVAIAALLLSGSLWIRLEAATDRLDETSEVVAGLAVQAAFVDQALSGFAGPLADELQPVIGELEAFSTATIAVPVDLDEQLPIDTEIALARTLQVPIQTEIPIRETIDTTVTVAGPLGVDIDLDVTVPVDVTVPIDLVVPFEIDEVVPVRTTVPVRLSFPLEFDVAGTPLADLALALRDGLARLAASLS